MSAADNKELFKKLSDAVVDMDEERTIIAANATLEAGVEAFGDDKHFARASITLQFCRFT
jgi:methanogenic corrinoid protein MtbC1